MLALKTLSTLSALVSAAVTIHMFTQVKPICKKFPTLSAGIHLFSGVTYLVSIQMSLCCKPFVTHRTHTRPWLVIMWMLSDIITISFSLNLKGTFSSDLNLKRTLTCTICTTLDTTNKQWQKCKQLLHSNGQNTKCHCVSVSFRPSVDKTDHDFGPIFNSFRTQLSLNILKKKYED